MDSSPTLLSAHLLEAEYLATAHRALWEEQVTAWRGTPSLADSARRFAASVFEPVRELVGPLRVTSGYRCGALNSTVGGRPTSRHVLALAADCIPIQMSITAAMDIIVRAFAAGALQDVDEAILELGWIHLQAAPVGLPPRRLLLETDDGRRYAPYLRRGACKGTLQDAPTCTVIHGRLPALAQLVTLADSIRQKVWDTLYSGVQAKIAAGQWKNAQGVILEAVQSAVLDAVGQGAITKLATALNVPFASVVGTVATYVIEHMLAAHDPAVTAVSANVYPVSQPIPQGTTLLTSEAHAAP